MAAYKRLILTGASSLALLLLTASLRAQPAPPPMPSIPPIPAPVPDPNQLTPADATDAQHNFALPEDLGGDFLEGPSAPSFVAVDFLFFKAQYGAKDLAYNVTGKAGSQDVNFDRPDNQFTPRITLRLMPFDELGISASWFHFQNFSQTFAFNNGDVNTIFTSAAFPFVPNTVVATTSGSGGAVAPTVVMPFNNFVRSPAPFFFLSLLPKRALGGGSAGTFEYSSNVEGGFPDQLLFRSSSSFQTADFKVDRPWQLGGVRGTIGVGAQYLYFSHSYTVNRDNPGGPLPTRYDFQDSDGDLFSIDPVSRFDDGPDFDHFFYSYHYTGVGPKIALELTWPPTGALQFFAKAGGAVTLGGRKEVTAVSSTQNGAFHDHDAAEAFADLAFSRTLNFSVEHNTFVALPIAEVEAGVSWAPTDWALKPLLKVSFIAQYYGGGGAQLNPDAYIFLMGVSATAGLQF